MIESCIYCENPRHFGLLSARTMSIERWGRFGPILYSELGGSPIPGADGQPMRAWAAKECLEVMHPNIHQMSAGPVGILCKKAEANK